MTKIEKNKILTWVDNWLICVRGYVKITKEEERTNRINRYEKVIENSNHHERTVAIRFYEDCSFDVRASNDDMKLTMPDMSSIKKTIHVLFLSLQLAEALAAD